MPDYRKVIKRLNAVTGNTFYLSFPSIANLIISFLVIRYYSEAWWGQIVELQIAYYVITSLTAWGNKEFLLTEFSRSSSNMMQTWSTSLKSRGIYLLVPSLIISIFLYPSISGIHLCIWIAMRFFQQSLESVFTFRKKFNALVSGEILAIIVLCILLFFFRNLEYNQVLSIITVTYFIKTLYPYLATRELKLSSGRIRLSILADSFAFMLLGFTAVVQTKADAFIVNMIMSKEELAVYGILTGLFLLIKVSTSFIILPFVKNILRLNISALKKINIQFLKFGLIITLAGLVASYFVMHDFYRLDVPILAYGSGIIFILPSFWYTPVMYHMFRQEMQTRVVWIQAYGIVINTVLCMLFIPSWGLTGALFGAGLSQVAILIFFFLDFNKLSRISYER